MDLKQALANLDTSDESHWTSDGLPRVDVVSTMIGVDVTRKQITDCAPGLTRTSAIESEDGDESRDPEPDPAPEIQPEPVSEFVPDDADVGVVMLRDEVLGMTLEEIAAGGHELADRALAEFSRQHQVLLRRRAQVDAALTDVSKRSEIVDRIKNRLPKDGSDKRSGLSAYLEQQRANRERKVKAAQRFVEQGTSARDVVSALDPRSQLDVAMQRRGAKRGETRPNRPVNTGVPKG